MKTIVIIAAMTLLSCTKEDNTPQPIVTPNPQCDCGIVQEWDVLTRYATVNNLCTGEEQSIYTGRPVKEGEVLCQ